MGPTCKIPSRDYERCQFLQLLDFGVRVLLLRFSSFDSSFNYELVDVRISVECRSAVAGTDLRSAHTAASPANMRAREVNTAQRAGMRESLPHYC